MKIRWRGVVRDVGDIRVGVRKPRGGCDTAVVLAEDRAFVWLDGNAYEFSIEKATGPKARGTRRGEAAGGLLSPMPGRIRQVLVAPGDRVSKGQVLLVLEAMKMEHAIRSPHDGTVATLAFREGDLVDAGAVLADVSPDSSESR